MQDKIAPQPKALTVASMDMRWALSQSWCGACMRWVIFELSFLWRNGYEVSSPSASLTTLTSLIGQEAPGSNIQISSGLFWDKAIGWCFEKEPWCLEYVFSRTNFTMVSMSARTVSRGPRFKRTWWKMLTWHLHSPQMDPAYRTGLSFQKGEAEARAGHAWVPWLCPATNWAHFIPSHVILSLTLWGTN